MKKYSGSKVFKVMVIIIIAAGIIVSVFPFYWMLVLASRESHDVFQVPPTFYFGDQLFINIRKVFTETLFFRSFFNTMFVATVQTILILIFSTLAGFTFAKLNFKGRNLLFMLVLGTMMIPTQLNIVPQYFLMDKIGWVGTYKGLIVPGLVNAFGIFWIKQYAEDSIPDSLIESARLDGATNFQILTRVAVPIIRPGLAFLALHSFMGAWNEYLWPLIILNDESKYTLQLALTQLKGLYTVDIPLVLTGSLLSVIPLILLFIVFSKQLLEGISEGAIKG